MDEEGGEWCSIVRGFGVVDSCHDMLLLLIHLVLRYYDDDIVVDEY